MFVPGIETVRVMLIDDVNFTRLTIRRMMEQIGFQDITEAEDGAEARDELAQMSPPPGLIVADYHMPGLDGLELLRIVRAGQINGVDHDIPFIMVTGEGKLESFISAIQLDVDAFLDKPTTRTHIEERIRYLLGEQKTSRDIKDPAYYQDMDVESAKEIFATIETAEPEDGTEEQETDFMLMVPGMILSRDFTHGKGHTLLAANTIINEEILVLLQKINSLSGGLGKFWARKRS